MPDIDECVKEAAMLGLSSGQSSIRTMLRVLRENLERIESKVDKLLGMNDETDCESHSCATCGTLEPDEHCVYCNHSPRRGCQWTPREK